MTADEQLRRHDMFCAAAIQNPALFTKAEIESPFALALKARRIADACLKVGPQDPINAIPQPRR